MRIRYIRNRTTINIIQNIYRYSLKMVNAEYDSRNLQNKIPTRDKKNHRCAMDNLDSFFFLPGTARAPVHFGFVVWPITLVTNGRSCGATHHWMNHEYAVFVFADPDIFTI